MAPLRETVGERKFNLFQGKEKKNFTDSMNYFREGVELYKMEKKSQALLKFQQSYGTFKTSESVYNIGVIYSFARSKKEEAKRAFSEAVRIEPQNPQYNRVLDKFGELMREVERLEQMGY